jgi:hypothetical protein
VIAIPQYMLLDAPFPFVYIFLMFPVTGNTCIQSVISIYIKRKVFPYLGTNDRTSAVGISINSLEPAFEALCFPKWLIYRRDFPDLHARQIRRVARVIRSDLTLQ